MQTYTDMYLWIDICGYLHIFAETEIWITQIHDQADMDRMWS